MQPLGHCPVSFRWVVLKLEIIVGFWSQIIKNLGNVEGPGWNQDKQVGTTTAECITSALIKKKSPLNICLHMSTMTSFMNGVISEASCLRRIHMDHPRVRTELKKDAMINSLVG